MVRSLRRYFIYLCEIVVSICLFTFPAFVSFFFFFLSYYYRNYSPSSCMGAFSAYDSTVKEGSNSQQNRSEKYLRRFSHGGCLWRGHGTLGKRYRLGKGITTLPALPVCPRYSIVLYFRSFYYCVFPFVFLMFVSPYF
uniref:Uncharacterized protein n=1 Tax=Trypanosoma congolense (strain IL3000) TaxID=1068625 RepID=F9W636_TRYCI|nr:hypothetical protein, unlikely [Trypanosoma congolense IL3000]